MYAYTVLLSRPKAAFQNRVRLSEKAYCLGDVMSWASAAAADLCYVLFCCLQWCNPVSVVCHCHDTLTGSESAVCCAGTSPRLNFVSLRDNWLTLAPKGLPVFRSPRIAYHSYFVFCFTRSSDIADNQCNFIRTALLLFVFSTCQSANAKSRHTEMRHAYLHPLRNSTSDDPPPCFEWSNPTQRRGIVIKGSAFTIFQRKFIGAHYSWRPAMLTPHFGSPSDGSLSPVLEAATH